jgi:hypothetical protein
MDLESYAACLSLFIRPANVINTCFQKLNLKNSVEITHSRRNTFRSFFAFVYEKFCWWF